MRQLAEQALERAMRGGVTYADVRVVEQKERYVSTKSGKIGNLAQNESIGVAVRVLRGGAWGFAATDDLTADGLERAAILACEIAEASGLVLKHPAILAPEDKHEAVWVSECRVDPFSIPIDRNLTELLAETVADWTGKAGSKGIQIVVPETAPAVELEVE